MSSEISYITYAHDDKAIRKEIRRYSDYYTISFYFKESFIYFNFFGATWQAYDNNGFLLSEEFMYNSRTYSSLVEMQEAIIKDQKLKLLL